MDIVCTAVFLVTVHTVHHCKKWAELLLLFSWEKVLSGKFCSLFGKGFLISLLLRNVT